jgi:hypothetical protein
MIVLNLKDANQCRINSGTKVCLRERHVVFENLGIQLQLYVIANIVTGYYWIDRDNRSVQLILYNEIGGCFTYEVVLGDNFFELFPEARDWWGDYFFRLHYAS